MDADALIDTYVNEVAQQLPRKQPSDVAFELRALLREELQAKAAAAGRPLDADLTLEGLRALGRPKDVAVRYYPAWAIIPAADTRSFLLAAVIGMAVLIALSVPGGGSTRQDQLGLAMLAWHSSPSLA